MPHLRVMSEALIRLADRNSTYSDFLAGTTMANVDRHYVIGDDDFSEDWSEVDGTVRDFGGPEFADHMSGHMFMRASKN